MAPKRRRTRRRYRAGGAFGARRPAEQAAESGRNRSKYAGAALVIGIAGYFFVATVGAPMYLDNDTAASPVQETTGTVDCVVPTVRSGVQVYVRLKSGVFPAPAGYPTTLVEWQRGQGAAVSYQRGKSGRVYIRDIQPLPAAAEP